MISLANSVSSQRNRAAPAVGRESRAQRAPAAWFRSGGRPPLTRTRAGQRHAPTENGPDADPVDILRRRLRPIRQQDARARKMAHRSGGASMRRVPGVRLLSELAPVALFHVDAEVLCGLLDVREG